MNKLPEINEIRLPCCSSDWSDPDLLSVQGSSTGLRFKIITKSGGSDSVYLDRESLVKLKEIVEQRVDAIVLAKQTN